MSEEGQKATSEVTGNISPLMAYSTKGYNHVQGKNGPSSWEVVDSLAPVEGRFGYTTVNSQPTTDLTNQASAFVLGSTSLEDAAVGAVESANNELSKIQ